MVFIGSYLPLGLILFVQNFDFSVFDGSVAQIL